MKEIPDRVSPGGQRGGGWVPVQYGTGTGLVLTKYKHCCVQNLFLLGEKRKWTQENKIWILKGKELSAIELQPWITVTVGKCDETLYPSTFAFFLLCFGWVHSMLLCISRQWWIVPQFCAQYRRVLDLIVLHLLYKRNELWATLQHLQWKWLSALLLARDITLSSRLPPLLGSLENAREFTVSCQWKLGVKHKTKSCQQLYIQFRCCRNFLLHFFSLFFPWVEDQSGLLKHAAEIVQQNVFSVDCSFDLVGELCGEKTWLWVPVRCVQGSCACTAQWVVMPGKETPRPSALSDIPQLFAPCSPCSAQITPGTG